MPLPDISEFYDKDDNALSEHLTWVMQRYYNLHADFVVPRFKEAKLKTAIEFGCGTGLFAQEWRKKCPELIYAGWDKSYAMLNIGRSLIHRYASQKNHVFVEEDVRNFGGQTADLSVAFGFTKHIGLEEWDDVVGIIMSAGTYSAFDVQILGRDLDNGKDWPHTFVTRERAERVIKQSGHKILDEVQWLETTLEGEGVLKNVAFWTKKADG